MLKYLSDYVLSWTFNNLPLSWNIWQLRFIRKSANIKVLLQNLGYRSCCVGKYFVFQRLVL